MTELHIVEARRHAFELFTLTSSIYPDEWRSFIAEKIVSTAFDFASHAYRVNELCDFDTNQFLGASICRYKIESSEHRFEDNYIFAINKVRHAKDLTLGWSHWDGSKIFLASNAEFVASYLVLTGNKHPGSISLFGLPFIFLTDVILHIKDNHKGLSF